MDIFCLLSFVRQAFNEGGGGVQDKRHEDKVASPTLKVKLCAL